MTWIVKRRDQDGKIVDTLKDNWTQAIELRDEIRTQGINAWIEYKDGTRVGYTAMAKHGEGV